MNSFRSFIRNQPLKNKAGDNHFQEAIIKVTVFTELSAGSQHDINNSNCLNILRSSEFSQAEDQTVLEKQNNLLSTCAQLLNRNLL